jgi:hypothetical protein
MTLIAAYEHLIGARGKEYVPPPPAPETQDEAQNPESLSADHTTPAVVAVSTAAAAKVGAEAELKGKAGAKNKARAKDKRKAASRKAKSRSAKVHPKKRRAS